jgi:surface protein
MFAYCKILTEIDLSKFDTSEVINMHGVFQGCESLIFINLSNFNTSNTVEFGALFYLCTKLISVDISNFDTENAVSIGSIFRECNSLISVNLSHFKTSKVTNMDFMFYKCEKLTSLDLSNFDTSSVTWIESAFDGCTSLEYINMKNAIENEKQLINCDNLFRDVPDNIVICLNELYTPNFTRQIQEKKCYINDCSDDWESKHLKRVDGFRCIFNNYFIHKNTNTEEYKFCSCKHCKDNYYPIENDKSNNNTHIYCYNNPEGYYLDKDDLNHNIYKPCYHICQKDLSDGKEKNNRCTSLNKEFPFILMDKDNYDNNCSNNFTYYFYIDNANNYFFTNSFSCPDQYPKLIKEKRECIKNCDLSDNYKYEFHNICYNQCPKNSKSSIENIYICKEMSVCLEEEVMKLKK